MCFGFKNGGKVNFLLSVLYGLLFVKFGLFVVNLNKICFEMGIYNDLK